MKVTVVVQHNMNDADEWEFDNLASVQVYGKTGMGQYVVGPNEDRVVVRLNGDFDAETGNPLDPDSGKVAVPDTKPEPNPEDEARKAAAKEAAAAEKAAAKKA